MVVHCLFIIVATLFKLMYGETYGEMKNDSKAVNADQKLANPSGCAKTITESLAIGQNDEVEQRAWLMLLAHATLTYPFIRHYSIVD